MKVTVETPSEQRMTTQYQQSPANPYGGGIPAQVAVPYWTAGEVKTHEGCHGAVVDGGALEIRRSKEGEDIFDYDVVVGYAPGAWAMFTNDLGPADG